MFDELGGHPLGAWRPAIDVMRRDDTLVVRADLPGLTPDEVKIEVEDGVLTVNVPKMPRPEPKKIQVSAGSQKQVTGKTS